MFVLFVDGVVTTTIDRRILSKYNCYINSAMAHRVILKTKCYFKAREKTFDSRFTIGPTYITVKVMLQINVLAF